MMHERIAMLRETRAKIDAELGALESRGADGTGYDDTYAASNTVQTAEFGKAGQLKTVEEVINDLFTYHPPDQLSSSFYETVRDAAKHFATVVWKSCPHGSDRTAAIRKIREAVMTANAAIANKGLSLP